MEMRELLLNWKPNKVWFLNRELSSRCSSTLKPTRPDKLPMLLTSTQDSIIWWWDSSRWWEVVITWLTWWQCSSNSRWWCRETNTWWWSSNSKWPTEWEWEEVCQCNNQWWDLLCLIQWWPQECQHQCSHQWRLQWCQEWLLQTQWRSNRQWWCKDSSNRLPWWDRDKCKCSNSRWCDHQECPECLECTQVCPVVWWDLQWWWEECSIILLPPQLPQLLTSRDLVDQQCLT